MHYLSELMLELIAPARGLYPQREVVAVAVLSIEDLTETAQLLIYVMSNCQNKKSDSGVKRNEIHRMEWTLLNEFTAKQINSRTGFPFTAITKSIMSLRPGILLSSAAKARCIANIKELPSFIEKNVFERTFSSVLVPLCLVNEDVCLLYTLRSSNLLKHRGQVSFPGGKRDIGETVIETALRETEEEIGFSRDQVDVWGVMSEVQGRDHKMIITPVVGQLKNYNYTNIVPNTDEVAEVFTVTMETLCDGNNHAHFMYKSILMPIFLCGKHKVWGITGLITHLFLLSFLPSDVYKPNFTRKSYQIDELMPFKSNL